MISRDDLDAAVTEGIIDAAQAVRIAHLARMRRAAPAPDAPRHDPDDEKFRLIGGFNDVFVTIGVGLLAGALLGLTSALGFAEAFAFVSLAGAWGLAEFFSRKMRLALPSIALALMFSAAAAFLGAIGGSLLAQAPLGRHDAVFALGAGLATMLAAYAHERRFHVPIDGAIAAAGAIAVVGGLLLWIAPAWTRDNLTLLAGLVGLCVFAVALRIDATDSERLTRRSDMAFWLHLMAAPLIVHPLIQIVAGGVGEIGAGRALLILAVFAVLGLVALVIDRRALLVSGLSYAGIAVAYLIQSRVAGGLQLPLTLLGLAAVVLGLSAGWRSLRALVLPRLPLGGLAGRLPPVEAPRP